MNLIAADIPTFMQKMSARAIRVGIVNGPEAKSEIPWQVSIRKYTTSFHWCGGTILDESTILSAGHCFSDYKLLGDYEDANFRVVTGAINLEDTSAQVQLQCTKIC